VCSRVGRGWVAGGGRWGGEAPGGFRACEFAVLLFGDNAGYIERVGARAWGGGRGCVGSGGDGQFSQPGNSIAETKKIHKKYIDFIIINFKICCFYNLNLRPNCHDAIELISLTSVLFVLLYW